MIRSSPIRHATAMLSISLACASVAGCGLPSGERLLDGSEVVGDVERELGIPLTKVQPVDSTAVLANVRDVYTGRSSNETLLIVDFNSAAATVQITSRGSGAASEPSPLTRKNIVVLYRHEPGTISRFPELRSTLAQSEPSS